MVFLLTYTRKLMKVPRAEFLVMVGLLTEPYQYIHLCTAWESQQMKFVCKYPKLAEPKTIHMEKSLLDPHGVTAKALRDGVGSLLGISMNESWVKNKGVFFRSQIVSPTSFIQFCHLFFLPRPFLQPRISAV